MLKQKMTPVLFLLCFTLLYLHAEELNSEWKIILPPAPHVTETYAAEELSHYVKRIAGIDLAIVKSAVLPAKKGIVIGTPDSVEAIRASEKMLRLDGDRCLDRLAVRSLNGNLFLAGNTPRSALYAVYTFLSEICGVRWLWPGPDGEFLTRKPIILRNPAIYWTAPFRYRGFHLCACYKCSDPETETWMARHKINIMRASPRLKENLNALVRKGFHIMFSDHNISLPMEKFKTNPELFALRNGKRIPDQLCWNNPKVLAHFIDHFIKICRQHPEMEILSLFPADNRNYCQCPACSRQTLPDLWFSFFMKIVKGVKGACPEKKFASIAYQGYQLPPENTDLSALEFLEYCQYERCFAHKLAECPLNHTSMARIGKWKKKDVKLGIYGYEFDIFSSANSFLPHYDMLADQIRCFRDMGIVSLIPEVIPLNTYLKDAPSPLQAKRLGYYIYAGLMNNPDTAVETLMDEYCDTAFGAVAVPMGRYFRLMKNAWNKLPIHLSHYGLTRNGVGENLLSPAVIAEAEKLFARAVECAGSVSDEKERKRLEKELAVERSVFQTWHDVYLQDHAVKTSVIVPRAVKTDDFSRAFRIAGFDAGDRKTYPTELRLYWDSEALHIRALCHDPAIVNLKTAKGKHDQRLWESGETLDLFFCTPEDLKSGTYRQFSVNPSGSRYDTLDTYGKRDESWNPAWTAETSIGKNAWTVRIRIPFRELGYQPRTGEAWRFSASRTNGKRKDFATSVYPSLAGWWQPHAFSPLYFTERTVVENVAIFARPVNYPASEVVKMEQAFQKNGFLAAAVMTETEFARNAQNASILIICHPNSRFDTAFYQKEILPKLENGAIVIFSSYGYLPLHRYFSMPELTLHWSGWDIDPERTIHDLSAAGWLKTPRNLSEILKNCRTPASGYRPQKKEGWENIGSIRMKNGQLYSCFLVRPVGRGLLVVLSSDFIGWNTEKAILSGNPEQALILVENLLRRNSLSGR